MPQGKELMMWILAVSLAITAVNQMGIFITVEEIDTGKLSSVEESQEMITGVREIDGIESDSDIADSVAGSSMLLSLGGAIWDLLKLVFLPYPYLVKVWHVPAFIAAPIQIILNVTVGWFIIHFWTGRQVGA